MIKKIEVDSESSSQFECVWMESDVNLTTLEPLMATKRYSNASYATLSDLLDLLT